MDELETGTAVVGCKLQEVDERAVEHRRRHLLDRVVSYTHLCHVSVAGHRLLHAVEQSHYAEGVTLGVALLHGLLEKHGARLCRCVLAQEHFGHHPAGKRILTRGTVIVIHGTLGIDIGGIGFQHLREKFISLAAAFVLHEPVAQHHGETGIIGMAVGKSSQCFICHLLIAHHLVDTHLAQRERVVGSLDLFESSNGIKHHRIVLLLFVELDEDVQHIAAVAVGGKEALVGLYSLGVVAGTNIELGEPLLVGVVLRTEHCGLFETFHCQCVLLELGEIHGFEVPSVSRVGIDVKTMVEQVKGCIIVSCLLLADRLQEEEVIPAAVVIAQRRQGDSRPDRCFLGCGPLAVLGGKQARHEQQTEKTEKKDAKLLHVIFVILHRYVHILPRRARFHRALPRFQTKLWHIGRGPSERCAPRLSPRSPRWRS